MQKQVLKRAHAELFRRAPDEQFDSLTALREHCRHRQRQSVDLWHPPRELKPCSSTEDRLQLGVGTADAFLMNDWSFSQLCKLSGVGKETVNRLTAVTASQVFAETLPRGNKPLQLFVEEGRIRSIHGASYTRLFDAELVHMLEEFAVDFQPPQTAAGGGTGLYAGEQDMFCFLIDPTGWTEIGGEAFAPGFFVWNSEVGRRSVGIQTFWFQAICQNHIVWDAVEVVEFSRKHTSSVRDALTDVRRIVDKLVAQRDKRRDAFAKIIGNAMSERLGDDADEALKALLKNGIPRSAAKEALRIAEQQGRFTIFALVDALTRIAGNAAFAGDHLELDSRAASLLALAV